jgi:hypothetical protein
MANDFSSDSNCLAVYNFADGALTTDDKGSNDLTATASAPVSNTTDYKQGACSADFEYGSNQGYYIADSSLPADWPLKNGTTNNTFSHTVWFRAESFNSNATIIAKHSSGKNSFLILCPVGGLRIYSGYSPGNSSEYTTIGGALTAEQWYFLGVSIDGKNLRMYLWDDTAGTATWASYVYPNDRNIEDAQFSVGIQANGTASTGWDGELDEVTVWKVALSMSDFEAIRAGTFSGTASVADDPETWYVDLASGSDTKHGEDWTNAKATVSGIPVLPGDTIKVAKTPAPVSLGSITWTNGAGTITLNSALTTTIDNCEDYTTWTAEANVTRANNTNRVQGSQSMSIAIASAFTTGKVVSKDLGASGIDLSAYAGISFMLMTGGSLTWANLRFDLCSDQACNTAVDSFTWNIGAPGSNINTIVWLKKDGGGSLGSSIKGIRIYATADPGAATIRIDNIIACNGFNHQSLVSTQNGFGPWFPIQAIDGTTVTLGHIQASLSAGVTYAGETTTCTSYYLEPFPMRSQVMTPSQSGDASNLITLEGGYNTTSDTVDGQTAVSWPIYSSVIIDTLSKHDMLYKNIQCCHATQAVGNSSSSSVSYNINLYDVHGAGCTYGYISVTSGAMHGASVDSAGGTVYCTSMIGNSTYTACIQGSYNLSGAIFKSLMEFWPGHLSANGYMGLLKYIRDSVFEKGITFKSGMIGSNNSYGLWFDNVSNVSIAQITIDYVNSALTPLRFSGCHHLDIGKLTITAASGASMIGPLIENCTMVRIGSLINNTGVALADPTFTAYAASTYLGQCDFISYDRYLADDRWLAHYRYGTVSDHITAGQAANWAYGGSGLSLVFNPSSASLPIFKTFYIPVTADTDYTLNFQKIRTGGTPALRIMVQGAGITPFAADVTLTDSWAEYTSSEFTPDHNGFITVTMMAKDGSSTGDIGIDNLKVVEA